jgi:hypothetical protein
VKQFYADIFSFQQGALDACEAKLGMEKDETQAHGLAVCFIEAKIRILMALYESYGMESTTAQCGRIVEKINRQGMTATCGVLRADLKQLRERWEDEYKAHYFLHLDPAQARQYQNPKKDWESIVGRFHKVSYSVEESGKCYALERYGAAVFHVLQVAEYGVIQVAKLLQVEGDRPGWGALKRLSDLIKEPFPKRSALAQQHTKLLENVIPLELPPSFSPRWREHSGLSLAAN